MKKTLTILVAVLSLGLLSGCSQWFARAWGGSTTVNIPAGEQLVTMTWKQTSLWVLTYNPVTRECKFSENSAAGVFEGTVHVPNCVPLQMTAASPALTIPK
jgi:hypothetical protein